MDRGKPRGVLSTIEMSRLDREFTPRGKLAVEVSVAIHWIIGFGSG